MPARLAIDIGGTFTDVVLAQEGRRQTSKTLTTHGDPADGVFAGIEQVLDRAGVAPAEVSLVIHGTTLATNALIERRGAVTALLTTAGHRDVLELAYEHRFEQYDINIDRPAPLVPRPLRLGLTERMDRDGRVLTPLDEDELRRQLDTLDAAGVQSVAIGFLHAYANPAHEQRAADILAAERPDWSLTLSSEVCPEIREYDRLSTACANAYVRPLMTRYLTRLAERLSAAGFDCPFRVMTSGGGLTTLDTATRFPIRLVESGPAGGAILARELARRGDMRRVLSFDMGGTTAKLCLIDDFSPLASRSFEVDRAWRFRKGSGLPVRIPVIEMVEIGAGGGSIASVDKFGLIQVGPRSAGSEPGPAAYGRGGEAPTVTDADVVLGRIVAERFAGGRLTLDTEAATAVIEQELARPQGMDCRSAAAGIAEIVDENMNLAARAHASDFGLALEERDLIAFGGAAPLHAARLGEKLGVRRILIPADAGVGSAVGFLLAPVAFEVVRSRRQRLSAFDHAEANGLMQSMHDEALPIVRQGAPDSDLSETRQAYMRYVGQGHEIAVTLPNRQYTGEDAATLRELFETAYAALYGQTVPGVDIEILSWTLALAAENAMSAGGEATTDVPSPASEASGAPPEPVGRQAMMIEADSAPVDTPVYDRATLAPGMRLDGPALITEDQTTTVVTPRYRASITAAGDILLEHRGDDA